MQNESFVCESCISSLPQVGTTANGINPVAEKLSGLVPYVNAAAVFLYSPQNTVARLAYDFKYHNFPSLARRVGQLMHEKMVHTGMFDDISCIVPVPIHWTRRLQRTYNQGEMIARGLSANVGVPVYNVLRARRHTSQTRHSGNARKMNIRGKYYAVSDETMQGVDHVLLVDDVCTTGSTLIEAANALLQCYPHIRISILTYAVTL